MGRRRSEWPEPWTRLKWAPGDHARLERLAAEKLPAAHRQFIDEMRKMDGATLQQVAFVRSLAKRYRVEPTPPTKTTRREYGDDY